jgi:hypothetical protein
VEAGSDSASRRNGKLKFRFIVFQFWQVV